MSKNRLTGRVVLVVEDEPLVALEVTAALRAAGARVLTAGFLEIGLFTTENPELSAAVIDLQLSDGNGTAICRRLHHLGVPFVVYTGFPPMLIRGEWPTGGCNGWPHCGQRLSELVPMLSPHRGQSISASSSR